MTPLFPERYTHGKWVSEHLEPDWMVDGHVMTNGEMYSFLYFRFMQTIDERREKFRLEVEDASDCEG